MFKEVSVCCCLPMLNAPEEQNRVESLAKAIAWRLVCAFNFNAIELNKLPRPISIN